MTMRAPLICLLCLFLLAAAGCSQASCMWDGTKDQVCETFSNPCCPDECGNVWEKQIYEPGCGGASPEYGGDRGAFSIPRTK